MLVTLSAAAAVLASACGQGGSPAGATGIGTPSSAGTPSSLPLSRGYLEIGTYRTDVFRPAFTIDIPVSSTWGTYGETGRRVMIGDQEGFFGFLALTAASGQAPTATAFVHTLRAQPGLDVDAVAHPPFAGLPAVRVEVLTADGPSRIEFGGQRLGLPRSGRAQLWFVEVGTAPVMIVLASPATKFRSFSRDALQALDTVQFQAG